LTEERTPELSDGTFVQKDDLGSLPETYRYAGAVGPLRGNIPDVNVYKESRHRELLCMDFRDRFGKLVLLLLREGVGVLNIVHRHLEFRIWAIHSKVLIFI
jgi:hypothetical protein